jgi:fido (protein-threonine AMPylation protein)
MRKQDKEKIRDLFFQLKSIYDNSPIAQIELDASLRMENIINSNAMENHLIDPVLLRSALHGSNVRRREFSSPVYRKAFLEIKSHDKLQRFLQVKARKKAGLTVSLLLKIHRLLFERSWEDIAGHFRDIDVRIRGVKHRPPHHTQVYNLIYQHLTWIDGLLKLLGPVNRNNFFEIFHVASDLQYRIISTYPFRDGNWRLARSLTDFVFLYCDMFYCIIDHTKHDEYLTAVSNCTITDFSQLEDLMLQCYGETLNRLKNFMILVSQYPEG